MSRWQPLVHPLLALILAPLLFGVINRVKALAGGRRGQPLLQTWFDIHKLLRKSAVYSHSTSFVFRLSPAASLAIMLVALTLVPLGQGPALLACTGDLVLFIGLLGLARFLTVLAALDTGSAFEGMGASREIQFALLAEPALVLGLAALAVNAQGLSLSGIYGSLHSAAATPDLILVGATLFILLLAENCRVPFDDPNTHLELTMIHEVMVLDHGGPDLGLITLASTLKLWIFAALITGLIPVHSGSAALDLGVVIALQFVIAVAVGCVESIIARLRFVRVPQLLVTAALIAAIAILRSLLPS